MTATDRIRAAIHRCIDASPAPPTTDDIAAAVLQEAAEVLFPEKPEPIEPIPMTTIRAINHAEHWSAWCALKAAKERLQALAQELNGTDYGNHIPDARKMVSPAEGEEPEVVALARPTDAQLIEEAIAVGLAFQPQDEVSEVFLPFDAEEPLDDLLVNFARAVLARYGHRPAPPAEGEVAELVEGLKLISDGMDALGHESDSWFVARAAELLEQRHPTPVPAAEREVQ